MAEEELNFAKQHVLEQKLLYIHEEEKFKNLIKAETQALDSWGVQKQSQKTTTPRRFSLMNELIGIHLNLQLTREILFLAVNFIDRLIYTGPATNWPDHPFLYIAASLYSASKYETQPARKPSLEEIISAVNLSDDGSITSDKVLIASGLIELDPKWCGPMMFFRRISRHEPNYKSEFLTKYLLETTIMYPEFVGMAPSFLAAGACWLARFMLEENWV